MKFVEAGKAIIYYVVFMNVGVLQHDISLGMRAAK